MLHAIILYLCLSIVKLMDILCGCNVLKSLVSVSSEIIFLTSYYLSVHTSVNVKLVHVIDTCFVPFQDGVHTHSIIIYYYYKCIVDTQISINSCTDQSNVDLIIGTCMVTANFPEDYTITGMIITHRYTDIEIIDTKTCYKGILPPSVLIMANLDDIIINATYSVL